MGDDVGNVEASESHVAPFDASEGLIKYDVEKEAGVVCGRMCIQGCSPRQN